MTMIDKAHDGDNDGFVHDGTPRMRPRGPSDTPKLKDPASKLRSVLRNRGERGAASVGGGKKKAKAVSGEAKEGQYAGGEKVTQTGASYLSKLTDIATKRHTKNGDMGGHLVFRALMYRDDKYAVNNIFNEYGLGDLDAPARMRIVEWLVKNGTADDIAGRKKAKAPRKRKPNKAGEAPVDVTDVDLPNRRQQMESKGTPADPGYIKIVAMKRAVVATKTAKASQVKRTKLTQQPIKNEGGEKPDHGDPTANKALRRVAPSSKKGSSRGGMGAKARRAEKRKALQEAYQRRQKGIEKKGRRPSPKAIAALIRSARSRVFIEAKVRRNPKGQFADIPDKGDDAPKKLKGRPTKGLGRFNERGAASVGKKPKKPPQKKQQKVSAEQVNELKAALAEAGAAAGKVGAKGKKKPTKPKQKKDRIIGGPKPDAPKPKSSGPINDFEAVLESRGDRDVFSELVQGMRDGDVKATAKIPDTLSTVLLFEDGGGKRFIAKRTSYDANAPDGNTTAATQFDHIDDFVASRLFRNAGVEGQESLGFASDPNDPTVGSVVMRNVGDTVGRDLEGASYDRDEFDSHEWADRSEFTRMMLMDYLTNNSDRHGNNWFETVDDDGKRHIVSIDHSLTGAAAARTRTQKKWLEPGQALPEGVDEPDAVEAAAGRSFMGFIQDQWLTDGDSGARYNLGSTMAQRVGVLYEDDDDETLTNDLLDMLDDIEQRLDIDGIEKALDDEGVTGDARGEASDMLYIVQRRLQRMRELLDSEDDSIVGTIRDFGSVFGDQEKVEELADIHRLDMLTNWEKVSKGWSVAY